MSEVHMFRVEVDRITTDLDGDDANWRTFRSRHPELETDVGRIADALAALRTNGTGATSVRIGKAAWPSASDYAEALSADDEACRVLRAIGGKELLTNDAGLVQAAMRANAAAMEPLFDLSEFPSVLACYAKIEVPAGMDSIGASFRNPAPMGIWHDPVAWFGAPDGSHTHRILVGGQNQHFGTRISQRISALGTLHGMICKEGSAVWTTTAERGALHGLARRFLAWLATPSADAEPTEGVLDAEAAAEDYMAMEWDRGWRIVPEGDDAATVAATFGTDEEVRAVETLMLAAARIDGPPIIRGLKARNPGNG